MRALLAGTVLVAVEGGNLIIEGDNLANDIAVDTVAPNTFKVVGLVGTTLNGVALQVTLGGVTGDVRMKMRGGNDEVDVGVFFASAFPRDLRIDTGDGNNFVFVSRASVGRDLQIQAAEGNDFVGIIDSSVSRDTQIETGGGADFVSFDFSSVGRDMQIETRGGADFVQMRLSSVGRDTQIETGGGNDTLLALSSSFGGAFDADGGGDPDTLINVDNFFAQTPHIKKFEL